MQYMFGVSKALDSFVSKSIPSTHILGQIYYGNCAKNLRMCHTPNLLLVLAVVWLNSKGV